MISSNISQDFGNDWGLYIDIENLNSNEEELNDKYTTQKFKKSKYYDRMIDYYENIYKDFNKYNEYYQNIYHEYEFYQKEINKNNRDEVNIKNISENKNALKYFTRLSSSIFITAAITVIVIFVI